MAGQCTYDSCLFKQDGPLGIVEYDSANPPEMVPDEALGFAALVGLGFTVWLDPLGRTVDLAGLEAMIGRMLDRLDLPDETARDEAARILKTQYGDEVMRRFLRNMFWQYPERPLSVGDSWTNETLVSAGFPLIVAATCALTGRQDGLATLAVHTSIMPDREATPWGGRG